MSQGSKLLLGALTFWPFLYIIFFFIFIFSSISGSAMGPEFMQSTFPILMIFHMGTIFMIFGLMIYYLVHAIRDETLTSDNKIIWVLVIVLAGMLGMPIYWWMRIWQRDEMAEAAKILVGDEQ